MFDVERGEIGADHRHHACDGGYRGRRQASTLSATDQRVGQIVRQRRADGLQIIARVKPLGNVANRLAQSLPIAQIG